MNNSYLKNNPWRAIVGGLLTAVVLTMVVATRLVHSAPAGPADLQSRLSVPGPSSSAAIADQYGELPLRFEPNQGQSDQQVKFLSRGPGYDLFLTATGAVLTLRTQQARIDRFKPTGSTDGVTDSATQRSVLRLKMIGASPKAQVEGRDELSGKVNYLTGNDQNNWRINIPTYLKVHYAEIYPGVDLVYYGNRKELEYDFVVAPGASIRNIKFQIDGADEISLAETGSLRLKVQQRLVTLRKPLIYQLSDDGNRHEVKGSYVLNGKQVGFRVKAFDRSKPLIIDPVLSYSTLLGAGGNEYAYGIAVDSSGAAYVTGATDSSGFPTTPGAFQTTVNFGGAFVSKLDPTGSHLIYSTYLSGSNGGTGTAIAVDSSGSAYITGHTLSADFPTVNPIRGGRYNLLKTTDSGDHWGVNNVGSLNEPVLALAIDRVTPTTIYAGMGSGGGIYKSTNGGNSWTVLNTGVASASGSALVIDPLTPSTIYAALTPLNFTGSGVYKSTDGGTSWTSMSAGLSSSVTALGIDPQTPSTLYAGTQFGIYKSTNGAVSWVPANTGITFGGFYSIVVDPVTPTTIYATAGGGGVFKTINGAASWVQVNTGLTGTIVRALAIDPTSTSTLYAGTADGGVFKTTNAAGNWTPINNGMSANISVGSCVLNPSAPATVLIGSNTGQIFRTTDSGNNWSKVFETITSTHFNALAIDASAPTTVLAGADTSSQSLGNYEAFVTKLNSAGSGLVYSTFLGGNGNDFGYGIAVDSSGAASVTGETRSTTFPAINAIQPAFGGPDGCGDGFVTKLNSAGSAFVFSTYLGGDGCDTGLAIAADSSGNSYATGGTGSTNFPILNAFQPTRAGSPFDTDAFATRFNANGSLGYSTYLGGNGGDTGYGIASDSSGNAYLTGTTTSSNFPTANPIQGTNGGSAGDAFVTKLNNLGSGLVYSTYLGGSGTDIGRGIALDSAGSAYITGFTGSGDFPLVAGAVQTRSGFYKSVNSGGTWDNDNYGLKAPGITCLALDPSSPAILYAGTTAGVYKSTDGGNNWNAINNGLGNFRINEIIVDPLTPANLYASSDQFEFPSVNGVYKSTNGGSSWIRVTNGMSNTFVLSLAIDPLTPATLYAGTYGGPVYKTTNGGGSWAPAGSPSIDFAGSLAVDPFTPTNVYAADIFSNGGIFKSIDAGASWQRVGFSQTGAYGTFVDVSPLIPAKVYGVTSAGLFRSIDGGANWSLVGPYAFTKVVFDPVNSSTLYLVTSSQGILRSTDDGQTWNQINQGLRSAAAIALNINPANPSIFYAAIASSNDDDVFVTRINPSGSALVYSTLLGGTPAPLDSSNLNDEGFAIAVDSNAHAYVAGLSRSPNFPVTSNSYQPFNRGFADAFVAKLTMSFVISGQVLDGSNAPVSGAVVTLSDGVSLSSIVTDSSGTYNFPHLREGGSFTVSGAKPHFTMAPQSQTFNNLNSNQTVNFIATATNAPFYTISGTVTNGGVGLSGVAITLSGSQAELATSDSAGHYSFTLAGGGSYTVTPALLGLTFSPPSLTFNNLGADQTTANFAASRQNFVVTNANNHGTGSLRQAMLDANATAGADTIVFNIPGVGVHTIDLLISLPEITDPVVIDATTQPGYAGAPLIELNGFQAAGGRGLSITAGGSTIRGLAIGRFTDYGIVLTGAGNNVIQANYIGLDASGTLRRGNNVGMLLNNSSNNLIGGTTAVTRNVISGNNFHGISISGSSNQITGNFIGTNAAGTAALGNGVNGIEVINIGIPPANNMIGGTAAGAGNLISGNSRGISMDPAGASIQGNLIGTDVSGTLAVGNGTGIHTSSANTIIGGTVPGARNVISGNNGDGVTIGGLGSRLEGNFIGVDTTGTVALGNGGSGVVAGNGVLIGGTTAAARNVISGNGGNGGFGNISLGSNNSGSLATVQGNYIGTDVTGNVALNNPLAGIWISDSSNLIGGLVPGAQNVISGNQVGIQIGGATSSGPTGNTIQGNLIGLNALGTAPLPNKFGGIRVSDSSNNVIGGTENGAANKIAFSGGPGVTVFSGTGNVVRGNSIFSSAGLGIDLSPIGITANDAGDADSGANNLQNFPLLTAVAPNGGSTAIQGTLNSAPNTEFRIDFYSNGACNASGNGEGARFFDTTNVTTDANGDATINFMSSLPLASGRVLTATATNPSGNTSEFSPCDATNAAGSLQFNTASYNMLEEVGNAIITVVRVGGSKGTLSVDYSSADGTATAGSDYTAVSGTLLFANGETSKTFSIPIVDDGVTEPAETAQLKLTAPDLETLGNPAIATLNILANNTPLVLNANEVSVPEGNGGATTAVVTVSLSAGTSQTVTANFSSAGNSATSGVDFTPVSGTLTFSPGITTQTISIPIINDSLNELDEDFGILFTNPTNASVGSSGYVLIIDDDPKPSISISDVSVIEGNGGTVSAVFNVSLSGPSGRSGTVFFQTANGTATAGSDYVARSSSLVFQPGETAKTISVTVNGDTTNEPDETFFVNIVFVAFATLADSQGIGTITNDDGPSGGSLGFGQTNYSVNEGAGSATITVNRTGGSAGEARVDYATSNSTATAGQDYTAASGTLIFPDGVTSQSFNVDITNDAMPEPDETISLALTNAAGTGSLGIPTSAVLKIIDNDPPVISISDVTETEGNTGSFNAFLTVTLSGQSSQTVTVDYATADGTATAGSDYQAGNGTVTFLPLQTVRVIAVRINGDLNFEPNETFNVNLSNPVNATINDAQGVGTIVNDDQPGGFIAFSQSNYTVGESAGLTTITVNRTNDLSGPATVDYATAEDSTVVPCSTANSIASSRCDYTTALGTLRFAAGESSKTFFVLISQDNFVEGSESLTLTLSNVTGNGALATPSTAILTIADDATEPATNPIDTADAFVRQHYHDFLNREPDAAGLAFWTNQITECQQPGATCSAEVRRINVSAAFFLSIEFQETGYLVYRFYKSAYGNIPGTPVPIRLIEFLPDTQQIGKDVVIGQPGAEQQLEANKVAYALDFVSRARFTSAYPTTLTPAQFVDALFTNAGVTPSAIDREAAINEFGGAGNTADVAARARALRRVAENSALKQQETNKAFVLMQYFGYLRRNPNDPPEAGLNFDGYNFWLGKLNEFNGNFVNAEMVKAFIVSGEYRHRFGP